MNTTLDTAAAASHAPAPPVNAAPARSSTVLLVEDDWALRRYLAVVLERAGYRVVPAADGLEAMKAALSQMRFDAVVTDAVMPHLGGHELCRFLRRHPKLSSLPVVLLSGADQTAASPDASERADIYLFKPVRPEELTACLAGLLGS